MLQECCRISLKARVRHKRRKILSPFMKVESCVLCGKAFSIDNNERRIQRKPHFINAHADFFGSEWNGLGAYMQEEVDYTRVLTEADKLNSLIQTIQKDLKWTVMPACNVISTW